jgi:large subunit ribosomal protein L35
LAFYWQITTFAPCSRISTTFLFTAMPKVKTNSGAKKRFKLTGTGKIKRKHAFHNHILTKKGTKRKRNLAHSALVAPGDERRIKVMLNLA